nr:septum formation initiator family protein [Desulfobulbaceae bacterium]
MRTYKLKKYKTLIWFVGTSLIVLLLWILFAPYGANKYSHISEEIDKVSADIENISTQNKSLNDEIAKLKGDRQYVEDFARKEYGLLKENEIIFEFKKK